ncbi:hypothetical protein M758_2G079200 [Ceratodon purpureus]|uniref:J domain-containing protein n=1 Tax=Ceratodon purpureus TaxID=3225 RepID=A0A8T0ITH7_CERPU|nr:hypothetical protein KC19_2G092100 [Ceratodon purpureus]KAG0625759.1 hypothetical protein M758_2G079200 [Ceratodon purpureus]
MQMKEAWAVLGLPSNATPLQVKIAYKRKALENHPDRFPAHGKVEAEARFKHISEAYTCLKNGPQATYGYGGRSQYSNYSGSSSWVKGGRRVNVFVASAPFALLIAGTIALGLSRASRAYRKQQKESPARNPFLP